MDTSTKKTLAEFTHNGVVVELWAGHWRGRDWFIVSVAGKRLKALPPTVLRENALAVYNGIRVFSDAIA